MPNVDQLDFLLSREPSLSRNVVYVYARASSFLRYRTTQKIIAEIEAGKLSLTSTDPVIDSPIGATLFDDDFCQFIDLGNLERDRNRDLKRTKATVGSFLSAVAEKRHLAAGLLLVVPASSYDPISGPVWYKTSWSNWSSMENQATIIAEPIISVGNVRTTVEKLMRLSDLSSMSRIRNVESLFAYLENYVEDEKPTLLRLSHQLDMAALTGVDRATGMFDAQVLQEEEAKSTHVMSIGASMRSLQADSDPRRQRHAIYALDNRPNKRSFSVPTALRELQKASELQLKNQSHTDDRLIFWSWMILTLDIPTSKGAMIDSYLGIITRYRTFCNSGLVGSRRLWHLDPILSARANRKRDDLSSLDRARAALADALTTRVRDRSAAAIPIWMLKLRLTLDLSVSEDERSMKHNDSNVRREDEGRAEEGREDDREQWSSDDAEPDTLEYDEKVTPSEEWRSIDRLQSFDDIVGQDNIRDALRARVIAGRVRDHVIIHGADGVGKRAIGTLYGQAIICSSSSPSAKPCGSCTDCVSYTGLGFNGYWYDVKIMIEIAQKNVMRVSREASETDVSRQSIERRVRNELSNYMSKLSEGISKGNLSNLTSAGNAVVLIDNAELMSPGMADRFLYALEKADTPTTCIFVTSDLARLRPALRSRCQAYRVTPLAHDRAMSRVIRACERLHIAPRSDVLQIIIASAGYRAGAIFNRLWNVYHASPATMQQARTSLSLDWTNEILDVLATVVNGDMEQAQSAFDRLGVEHREALSRLRITMRAIDTFERVSASDRDAILPSAFMYADGNLVSRLRELLSEAAAQIPMTSREYLTKLMTHINHIDSVAPASVFAEIMMLSCAMRGKRSSQKV